jgi:hypothetical protein
MMPDAKVLTFAFGLAIDYFTLKGFDSCRVDRRELLHD